MKETIAARLIREFEEHRNQENECDRCMIGGDHALMVHFQEFYNTENSLITHEVRETNINGARIYHTRYTDGSIMHRSSRTHTYEMIRLDDGRLTRINSGPSMRELTKRLDFLEYERVESKMGVPRS